MLNKKKRILVCSHWLDIGGAERALIGLLESLSHSEHEVDLFLCRHTGEFLKDIPANINLLPEQPAYAVLAVPIWDAIRNCQFAMVASRIYSKVRTNQYIRKNKITGDCAIGQEYTHKYAQWATPTVGNGTYDLAISFLSPHYIVAEKVLAKQKLAWIHTDYSKVCIDSASELAMWSKFDHIASISNSVTDSFIRVFPSLADKVILIENILSESLVQSDAQRDISSEIPADGSIRLLSIGRFSNAKNFDNVPDICKRLLEIGLNVKWYLIGYGGDEALIRSKITESHMENHVIILGKKDNPYPYIAACDLYVQPSRYEGKCVAVREAQMLGKPVVITNYATSASQLEDGVDGIIVPMDNDDCAKGIAALLCNPEKMTQLSNNCRKRNYSNAQEVEKIYSIILRKNIIGSRNCFSLSIQSCKVNTCYYHKFLLSTSELDYIHICSINIYFIFFCGTTHHSHIILEKCFIVNNHVVKLI